MNIFEEFTHNVPGCEGPIVEFSGGASLFSDAKQPAEYMLGLAEVDSKNLMGELQRAYESGDKIYICTTCKAICTIKS